MSSITLNHAYAGQVLEITLDAPPANVLSAAMMGEISSILEQAAAEPDLKLLRFVGAGKHFSYGASVAEHAPDQVAGMLRGFHDLIEQLLDHPVPSMAVVRGQCLGGGFELALAATLLLADDTAMLGVPEIRLGVFPPVAAALLPTPLAARMILGGQACPASELQSTGVVTSVSHPEALDGAVTAIVEQQILPLSASSLRFAHRALRKGQLARFRALIGELESLYLDELMASQDAREGIQSFLDKRPPRWSNG